MKGLQTAPRSVTAVLWGARILTLLVIAFWGCFIFAYLLGDAGASFRELTIADYIGILAKVASLLGLGVAFKWETLGATVTLAAVAIGAFLNWRILLFPATLIPIAALLFLVNEFLNSQKGVSGITTGTNRGVAEKVGPPERRIGAVLASTVPGRRRLDYNTFVASTK